MKPRTKATVRNGRAGKYGVYSPNHNTLEESRNTQSHIDHIRTSGNIYYKFTNEGKAVKVEGGYNAREHELDRYNHIYGDWLQAQNKRHLAARQKARVRTMEQVYQDKRTAPMETILQVGNSHSELDRGQQANILWGAACDLVKELMKKPGIELLDMTLHRDEKVVHIHLRYCYKSQDRYGHNAPNQTQALKDMGYTNPKEGKTTRYNNPLIAFTDETRERFYQLCEARGIEIDREVISPSQRHQERQESRCAALEKLYELITKRAFREMDDYLRNRFIDTYELHNDKGQTKSIKEIYNEYAASQVASMEQRHPELSGVVDQFQQYVFEDREM